PNPGKGYIHVELPQGMALPVQYQIADMQGQVRESGMQSSEVFKLESGYLTQGMYIISIRDKNGTVSVGKWIKD
ncbi:MAG: T9SS type A sorting domain-containing protein, partial [Saprospiraceae bacterium]|nr:T9SS type A sorting domain-containing protein [Saprospiraceae bacterium]